MFAIYATDKLHPHTPQNDKFIRTQHLQTLKL